MSVPQTVMHHRFTVEDYHRMGQAGILGGDTRVELVEGELIDMAPIGSRHAGTVAKLARLLERAVGDSAVVWTQNPLVLGECSEPEPDLALLRPRGDFYTDALPGPGDVLLVVEVADTSLEYDRDTKLPMYARHGVAEAWLVDLVRDGITIHQDPSASGYRRVLTLACTSRVALPGLAREVDLSGLL